MPFSHYIISSVHQNQEEELLLTPSFLRGNILHELSYFIFFYAEEIVWNKSLFQEKKRHSTPIEHKGRDACA